MKKPLIVFVFAKEGTPTSPRYGGFAKRLQEAANFPDAEVLTVALKNLAFVTDGKRGAHVYDTVSGHDLGKSALVYLKSWESMPDEAAALSHYLLANGVPCYDTLTLGQGISKLPATFRHWAAGVSVPASIYCLNSEAVLDYLQSGKLGEKFIMKDAAGEKGKLNFLVNAKQAKEKLEEYPDGKFIFQQFIPNTGDYRVGIYAEEARFVLLREGNGKSHLNNTSAGGKGTFIPISDAPKAALKLAKKAAAASELQIAGVDVIQDSETGNWYVLEANQGSQIVTGAFVEQNKVAFNEGIASLLKNSTVRNREKPRKVIGRRTIASLPGMKVKAVIAKVDTGAYSSTLHAENIVEHNGQLSFDIIPSDTLQTATGEPVRITTKDYFEREVRSSNGHAQKRYSIRTKISLEGTRFDALLMLSDRSQMRFPLLVGRRLIRSRFVVNVELDENYEAQWKPLNNVKTANNDKQGD